jgi:hypothetical protein
MSRKIKSDAELRQFFKERNVNVLKIIHRYEPLKVLSCSCCSYVTKLCWLCDQCESCCLYNVEQLEYAET